MNELNYAIRLHVPFMPDAFFCCKRPPFCWNVMSKNVVVNVGIQTIGAILLNIGKRSPIRLCCLVGQRLRAFASENTIHCPILFGPDTSNMIQYNQPFTQAMLWKANYRYTWLARYQPIPSVWPIFIFWDKRGWYCDDYEPFNVEIAA